MRVVVNPINPIHVNRSWRERVQEGNLNRRAALACNLGRVAADEILIDRLIAARQVQARIQGVA